MSDVTFVRGYGFPRGSRMDYAGMGDASAAAPGSAGPMVGPFPVVELPEPELFSTIPPLDGYDGPIGDTTLPQLDLSPGAPSPAAQGYGMSSPMGVIPLIGLAVVAWALFSK